jgi:hypothetical protein
MNAAACATCRHSRATVPRRCDRARTAAGHHRLRRGLCAALATLACALAILALTASSAAAGKWPWSRPDPPPQTPHPAVVRVVAQEHDGISAGSGTLVDVREQFGLVVTNWHVVRDATGPINVIFPDGFRSPARVLRVDRDWDLAALLIWRPNVTPVALAPQAPRPGDPLTIAGYGPGVYRAVPGRCTQYVAPSTHHPYEMVEVSTMAREGDSGGPIFNERGELAGVLFGSGGGTTAGSYAGRVREFLQTAWQPPPSAETPQTLVAATANADHRAPVKRLPPTTGVLASKATAAEDVAQLTPLPKVAAREQLPPSSYTTSLAPPTPDAPVPAVQTSRITWEAFAGETTYQQIKTVLAIIGLAAIFLQVTRASRTRE